MTQCSSCGGFCGRVCQRDNTKALELACYYQNRCCDLEEIIELFCMDAEVNQFWPDWDELRAELLTAIGQEQDRNFCPRCGKRTNDLHTCTPPEINKKGYVFP